MEPLNTESVRGRAVRVFVLSDETPVYRHGLRAIIGDEPSFVCVGEATSCALAMVQAPALVPDVVLVDAALVAEADSAALQALRRQLPRARLIVLSGQPSPVGDYRAVAAGVACVLPKSAMPRQLIDALLAAHGGQRSYSASITDAMTAVRRRDEVGADLTPRERDLLALMAKGLSNHDISGALEIGIPTVKFHVGNIMSKLNADNRTSAVLVALRHKLVELG